MSEPQSDYLANRDTADETPQPPALPPPGLALDRLVAERVMGFDLSRPEWAWGVDSYSTKIDQAWQVVERMHKERFSVRRRFFRELDHVVTGDIPSTTRVAWPDALLWLKPHHICLAALHALEVSHGQ